MLEELTAERFDDYVRVKKEIIQNNIYGVDIEQGAVDIARLRFWLALLVDAKEPEALPNLNYKIMRGNSLIPTFDGQYINLEVQGLQDKAKQQRLQELLELQGSYYALVGDEKCKAEIRIKQLVLDIVALQISKELRAWEEKNAVQGDIFEPRNMEDLKKILPEEKLNVLRKGQGIRDRLNDESISLQERANTDLDFFDWHIMFSDVFENNGGFDIVIGNPPYIQLQKSLGFQIQDKKGRMVDAKLGDLYEEHSFETFERTGDIYCLFYEQGQKLLCDNGNLMYITSNKWMRAGYGCSLRAFFASKTNPLLLIDFAGVKVFDTATVDTNILLFSKSKNEGRTKSVITSKDSKNCLDGLDVFVRQNSSESSYQGEGSWMILSPIEQSIKQKIEAVGVPLKDWDITIYRGVLTGCNEAFIITTEKHDEILSNCETDEERRRTEELMRPILRGRDIKRYEYAWAGLWLINTHNGVGGKFPPIDINDYPSVKQHLDCYWEDIKKRADKGVTPYNLRNCAYLEDFSRPKVIYPETTQGAYFAYDEEGVYLDKTCFMLISDYAQYIQATLSSELFEFAYKNIFSSVELGSHGYQYNKHALVKLPIMKPADNENVCGISDINSYIYSKYNISSEEITYIKSQLMID